MTTQFLSLAILIFSFACNSNSEEKQVIAAGIDSSNTIEIKGTANIRFDFTATRNKTNSTIIEIIGTLYNDNIDTVYFFTHTCDGDQYLLRYDTARFELTHFMICNALFPKKQYIAPKSHYDFLYILNSLKTKQILIWV